MDLLQQYDLNVNPGPHYEKESPASLPAGDPAVRLIAYYLPQFHPFPENDEWWGKGFTEWTGVTKALPRFEGHYQPHLPGELGFYDLRLPDVLRAQAALARRHGIHGFCFHYYWFGGKRLLERPLDNLLAMPDVDLPFCVNWANENWSRRWNGLDKDILIGQQHSDEDDLRFADAMGALFKDPRYIRVDGRPLLMLYRPAILPDSKATTQRWREHLQANWGENPYLVMAQVFNEMDPRPHGMDAAAGFPPHNGGLSAPTLQDQVKLIDPRHGGTVLSYADMATRTLANKGDGYPHFPGVCPGWDNEARKPNRGTVFIDATPERYAQWLREACLEALKANNPDERIVFINAWNEWGEGAHIEPDRHFGYAFLNETGRVLEGLSQVASTPGSGASAIDSSIGKSRKRSSLQRAAFKAADYLEAIARRVRARSIP